MADTKKKILIIEDDSYIRELYEEVLKDEGFEVESAIDGEAGLTKIRQGGYDLILLDMMLPKVDGLGVLRSVKNEPPIVKNGPIILVTNLAHDPVLKMAEDLGVKHAIIKSEINPGELVEKIKDYLSNPSD